MACATDLGHWGGVMEYRTLGRTGLRVSLAGLGTGGPSNFGQNRGTTQADAQRLVCRALDCGINFFDTAQGYRESEAMLGHALQGVPRDQYIVATKYTYQDGAGTPIAPSAVEAAIEQSLRCLRIETIDVEQVHGLAPEHYDAVIAAHLPVLERARAAGKIRHIGVSETFGGDAKHAMLGRALADGHFATAMVAYNLLHQTAERTVFPRAQAAGVGVIIMVAVRRVLGDPQRLRETIAHLKARRLLADDALPDDDALGWLVHDGVGSVPAAAYKFALEPAAVSTVLTGTANPDHLDANVTAIAGGPLPTADRQRLQALFGHLEEGLGN
ncbi:MAG: aldo/keto reductase [Actinobacteria bacterium]|nr:aldo/keto reductase [Actinomycetota bacterium]